MRKVCVLLLLLLGSCRATWWTPTMPSTMTWRRGSVSPQVSEPVSLRSIQQALGILSGKIDLLSKDLTEAKHTAQETYSSVREVLKKIHRSTCDDIDVGTLTVGAATTGTSSLSRQNSVEGVFTIHPLGGQRKKVKCDVDSDGETGWMVVLSRHSGSVQFNRTYEEYREGFGDPSENVWIGLETLHEVTSSRPHQLRVEMSKFDGTKGFALYEHFAVGNLENNYQLSVSGYDNDSTAGDALRDHHGMVFSTYDLDNDKKYRSSCSNEMGGKGGWWYNSCYNALGTGEYRTPPRRGSAHLHYGGVTWFPFVDVKATLSSFKMMIKPQ